MTQNNTENIVLDGGLVSRLRAEVEDLFHVFDVELPRYISQDGIGSVPGLGARSRARARGENTQGTIIFVGNLLRQDSKAAYDLIAERWRAHNYTPMLRRHKGQVALVAQPGIVVPRPSNSWINFWLAVATIISMVLTGSVYECLGEYQRSGAEIPADPIITCLPRTATDWSNGLPMMLAMMAILLAHEFGHYFAARYHKIAVTLPYFIPVPIFSPVGTLGAVIQLRSPFKTKKELFDIGVAGPLGGLIFAIPLVFWGVANSPIRELNRAEGPALEGNSFFYLLVKYFVHGDLLPSFDAYSGLPFWQEFFLLLGGLIPAGDGSDILINTFTIAAWFGLFVTAMNLLPIGQLDGGHIIYCLLGDKARVLGMSLIVLMVLAGIFLWPGWLLWAGLTYFVIGPNHPPPLNDLIELDPIRKTIAYLVIVLFVILFMPTPFQFL